MTQPTDAEAYPGLQALRDVVETLRERCPLPGEPGYGLAQLRAVNADLRRLQAVSQRRHLHLVPDPDGEA